MRNISGHEPEVDDIKYSLNDMGSHFKLIDLKFRIIDKARWNEIIDAEAAKSRLINIRLVKVDDDSHLTLTFAERKLQACVRATFILLGFTAVREGLLLQQKRLRLHNHEQKEVEQLDSRVNVIIATIEKVKRSRNFNRFLLYAARCHILDPRKTVPEKQRLDGNHGIFQQGSEKQVSDPLNDLREWSDRETCMFLIGMWVSSFQYLLHGSCTVWLNHAQQLPTHPEYLQSRCKHQVSLTGLRL